MRRLSAAFINREACAVFRCASLAQSLWTSRYCRLLFLNKRVNNPDGIVVCDQVIETFWQRRRLVTVRTFDKSPHLRLAYQQVNSVQAIVGFDTLAAARRLVQSA
jgi:hypothetical protein